MIIHQGMEHRTLVSIHTHQVILRKLVILGCQNLVFFFSERMTDMGGLLETLLESLIVTLIRLVVK